MDNKAVKYVIFDFDGTLADSGEISFRAINRMAEKHKFDKLDWDQIDELRDMTVKERSRFMGVPLYKMPLLAPEFYGYYKEEMKDMNLNKGIENLLEGLQITGVGLAVISSNSENNISSFLERKSINAFSDIICSRHLFSKDKIIKKFIKNKSLRPEEVIYVGDETRDIEACKKVGIKIIWVDWGLDKRIAAEKCNPDYLVSNTKEIYEIVMSHQ